MADSRSPTQIVPTPEELALILLIRTFALDASKIAALGKVARGVADVQYGDVTIRLQAGKVIWVDKYERERVG